jgi:hopanoid biosynthesis associated radical SAM protein HpnH
VRFPISLSLSLSSYIMRKRLAGTARFPLVLMLEPLHTCNLSCSGCGRIREYSRSLDSSMPLDECLDSAIECGAPIVSICGGEPLIYTSIGELTRRLNEMGRHIYLCTNGLLLRAKLGEFAPSSRLIFNVHLDGQEETHDTIVGRKGTFAEAVEGIRAAKLAGFIVSTNTTIYRETDMADVEALLERLSELGVDTHMISPGYDYEAVRNGDIFLDRKGTMKKFRAVDRLAKRFPLSDTPLYLEFLKGERDMPCAPWANPTMNPSGWRSPCYMLADAHYASFRELMEQTDWNSYGPGHDERCADCMVHCGFEPSAVLSPGKGVRDLLRLAAWQLS